MRPPHDNALLEWIDAAMNALRVRAKETRVVDWLIHNVPGMHRLDTPLGRCALQQEYKRAMLARISAYGQTPEIIQEKFEDIAEDAHR
jgi:hypothetical protein